jgi:hypothetical protein
MCEGGCIYLSPMSRGAPPSHSKSEYVSRDGVDL